MSTERNIKQTRMANFYSGITQDVTKIRQLRFAFGATLSAGFAYAINWPLAFLLPVF